ncbi:Rne/Rng family ribonuclease [Dietzia massiliensis]|uniref:Rne/Rng family ribonuclease n=1 Tax=Dietzia massiliensis TaxID=2697499 RepID=UPI001BD0D0E7|nr:Rne/Rng family ribonuclease [Dietzia massiliensis]MBS7546666.1 ribonuclease E/G [Dietzia massiliensis]
MSDPNLTIDDLAALPERMRAHAAAKAVGMTSKEFLAAMAGIGVEIKSAQSGVTRDVLLTWFNSRSDAPAGAAAADRVAPATEQPADTAEAIAPEAPSAETPAKKAPARKTAAKKASATKASAKKSPARKTTAEKTAEKATAAEKSAARTADDTVPAEDTRSDAARTGGGKADARNRPPLPEIAIVTGEVGAAEPGNRRRRSTATPSFSPLFLSPEDTAAATERSDSAAQSDSTAPTDSATRSDPAAQPASTEQSDSGEGGTRRRRRGRRGRGRGRGEGGDEQNGQDTTSGPDAGAAGSDDATGDDANDADDRTAAATASSGDADGADASDDAATAARGTGRDRSDDAADRTADDADGQDESGDDDADESDDSSGAPSGSRRRRRRRRRGGGSGADDAQTSSDDPPHTEVHERDPRRRTGRAGQGSSTSSDEVQGITGSTRLEAKRQRRRDGREAGRRRQPILSEAEFLARREAVDRVMVVREKQRTDGKGLMTQVGVLEDKVLVEHFVTTESARSMVGNVYLGRVQNVLPSMEAAFVDIGRGRNGVLYAGEVNWEAAGLGGKARRIEQALKSGDMVLVQVTKDPVGQKGARLSTQISLAGRFLVYVPDGNSTGISRKLPDTERRRLKGILKEVVPEGSGVIIRTAAEGVSAEEIGRDVERLAAQWTEISEAAAKRTESGSGTPVALYEEPDLLVKVVRDLFNEDFSKLVIQGETSWNTVHGYVSRVAPEMVDRLERHDNPDVDVFATHRVDEQLAKALDRKVWLPSGGSLVIDRTEAMTVIDVNTGKYTGSGGNLEETVTKNNLEAAEEIVRQLRLRDVGGMVIIDFIDMVLEANRDLVLRRLTEALGRDRTRHQVSEVTSLGLVQLTRKKLGTGLVEAFSTPCEHCQGRGLIVHADPLHTESHNADEPGAKRGRRRGGNGKGNGESDSASPKQAPRKDGPAPAAHPAALAIARQNAEAGAGGTDSADQKTVEAAEAAAPAVVTAPPAEAGTDKAGTDEADAPAATSAAEAAAPSAADTATASEATPSADESETAPAAAPEAGEADSADAAGVTRPARRRRASRRPASNAPAPETAAADSAAAEVVETPQAESATVAEADAVVDEVESATSGGGSGVTTAGAASADAASTSTTTGRRPRRRSTRRAAGAATADSAATASAGGAATAATASSAAPAASVEPPAGVEAAPLAQTPTAVVAEPRRRPARRRATRSTTAPTGD